MNTNEVAVFINDDAYKYDLEKQTYAVTRMKGDTVIPFHLTAQEKAAIVDRYFAFGLDKLHGKEMIEDNCDVMPRFYTTLKIRTGLQNQEIIIDDGCGDYKALFDRRGKRVAAFLSFVRHILKEKPEIKNAPLSDILYL